MRSGDKIAAATGGGTTSSRLSISDIDKAPDVLSSDVSPGDAPGEGAVVVVAPGPPPERATASTLVVVEPLDVVVTALVVAVVGEVVAARLVIAVPAVVVVAPRRVVVVIGAVVVVIGAEVVVIGAVVVVIGAAVVVVVGSVVVVLAPRAKVKALGWAKVPYANNISSPELSSTVTLTASARSDGTA